MSIKSLFNQFAQVVFMTAAVVVCTTNMLSGQVSNYSFSTDNVAYTPIIGGTVLGVPTNDDTSFPALPIGFNFVYNNISYSTFGVNSNGFIAMGSGTVYSSYTAISTGSTNNIASALNFDLQGTAVTGSLSYTTVGTAPCRMLVVQWSNYHTYPGPGDLFNFQIRLHETTGVVDFVYGPFTKDATVRNAQVGLRGASNADFNNRTTPLNWAISIPGGMNNATCRLDNTGMIPVSGQVYIFTPLQCSLPVVIAVSGSCCPPATGTVLTASAASCAQQLTYAWSNGANTQTITTCDFGTYCVTVTDANGCTGSACYTIAPDCCNYTLAQTGGAPVEALFAIQPNNGAPAPTQIQWSIDGVNVVWANGISNLFTNLNPGQTYHICVTFVVNGIQCQLCQDITMPGAPPILPPSPGIINAFGDSTHHNYAQRSIYHPAEDAWFTVGSRLELDNTQTSIVTKSTECGALVWTRSYFKSNISSFSDLEIMDNGNLLVLGNYSTNATATTKTLTILNPVTGAVVANRTMNYNVRTLGAHLVRSKEAVVENYYIGHWYLTNGGSSDDLFVTKININNNIISQVFSSRYGDPSGYDEQLEGMIPTNDGGLLLLGGCRSVNGWGPFAIQLNPAGNVVFQRQYNGMEVSTNFVDGVELNGFFFLSGNFMNNAGDVDAFTCNVNPNLNIPFQISRYNTPFNDFGGDVVRDNAGNIYVSGFEMIGAVKFTRIMVYDASGAYLNTVYLDIPMSGGLGTNRLITHSPSNDNIILVGQFNQNQNNPLGVNYHIGMEDYFLASLMPDLASCVTVPMSPGMVLENYNAGGLNLTRTTFAPVVTALNANNGISYRTKSICARDRCDFEVDWCYTIIQQATGYFQVAMGPVTNTCGGNVTVLYSYDGGASWTGTAYKTYNVAGVKEICVKVRCTFCGQTCERICCKSIYINGPCKIPSTAGITAVSVNSQTGTVTYTASTLVPAAAGYDWDFDGDGVVDLANGPKTITRSVAPGNYNACVTIISSGQCTKHCCQPYTVVEPCNVRAYFRARYCSSDPSLVMFEANGVNVNMYYVWDLGNMTGWQGTTASAHYAPGTYTICLEAYKSATCYTRSCYQIIVAAPNCHNQRPANVQEDPKPEEDEDIEVIEMSMEEVEVPDDFAPMGEVSSPVQVYPNPTDASATFQINLENEEEGVLQMFDLQGQVVWEQKGSFLAGENQVIVPTSTLSPGIYQLRFNAGDRFETVKLVVQR